MTIFLSKEHKIAASGLYYYRQIDNTNNYRQFIIDRTGEPILHASNGIDLFQNVTLDRQMSPNCAGFTLNDWIAVPGSDPPAYLTLARYRDGQSPVVRCQLIRQGQNYFLPKIIYRTHLIEFLWNLYDRSYQRINRSFLRGIFNGRVQSMGPFWTMIALVGEDMIGRVGESFKSPTGNDKLKNPDWAFQLIRIMTQGFSEGHASFFSQMNVLPGSVPGLEAFAVESVASWAEALTLVEDGFTLERFAADPQWRQRKEDLYLLLFGESVRNLIAAGNLNLLDEFAEWWLNFITPGSTEEEELAFWLPHDPHYLIDLRQALREHGKREPNNADNRADWDTLEAIILENFPTKGRQLSLADKIIASALRQLVDVAPDFKLNPRNFMVARIFAHVRQQVP